MTNEALLQELRSLGRPALLGDTVATSGTAGFLCGQGQPLATDGESWPLKDGAPLLCVLTVHTPELPFVPDFLVGYEYWAFYIEPQAFEQVLEDGSLVVRRYRSVAGLGRLAQPPADFDQPLQLCFREAIDFPSDSVLAGLNPAAPALAESHSLDCHSGIKLGGYPHLIQGTAFLDCLDPDFQIQLDISDHYMYCDSGIGYVYSNLSAVVWETM